MGFSHSITRAVRSFAITSCTSIENVPKTGDLTDKKPTFAPFFTSSAADSPIWLVILSGMQDWAQRRKKDSKIDGKMRQESSNVQRPRSCYCKLTPFQTHIRLFLAKNNTRNRDVDLPNLSLCNTTVFSWFAGSRSPRRESGRWR